MRTSLKALLATTAVVAIGLPPFAFGVDFDTFVSGRTAVSQPLGSGDKFSVIQGGITKYLAGNLVVDTTSPATISNKIINGNNNTLTVLAGTQLSGSVGPPNGGSGLSTVVSGAVICGTSTTVEAWSSAPAANTPMVWGGAGACPGGGSTTGPGTLFLTGSGVYTNGHGLSVNSNGNIVDNANAVFTNVSSTFTAQQILGSVRGKLRTVSGVTDTLDVSSASTSDCGGTVNYTNTSQITVTAPATAVVPCVIALQELNTGRVVVSAASGATVGNPHGFTGTFNQPKAIINLTVNSNAGGNAADYTLSGDGA